MATPSTRTPVRIARGSYSNLNSSLSDLQDGEIMYAEDQDKLYIKEGSSLVVLTQPAANAVFTGNVTVNAQGDLRLADSDSSNYVGFQSPATVSANVVWTLPAADGSANQLLKTNGSGVLSWGTVDLSSYAPLASPTLTGTPAAPTASANTNTTQIATTAFVMTELGDYAPLAAPAFTGTATGVNLTLSGNLTVNGTTTTIDTTNLDVEDKNITIGKVSTPSDATADGGGITLKGASDKTWNWVDSTDAWTSSEHIDLASGKVLKVAGSQVLSAAQYTGNAATATALATARTIGGTSFDGSANIAVALAGTATALATARTIAGVSFDGTANISLNNNAITNGAGYITSSGTAAGFSAGNASNLNAGTVPIGRLGSSGTASATTFLRGDGAWAAAGVSSDANENTAAGTGAGNSINANTAYNTAFGYNTLYTPSTGDSNTAFGRESLRFVDTGSRNTAVGVRAGYSIASGTNHTCIGAFAGYQLGYGSYNIAIGDDSFGGAYTGTDNIAIGRETMDKTSGALGASHNLCIGQKAGNAIQDADHCILIGDQAGSLIQGGSDNIFIGEEAGKVVVGHGTNIGIGRRAMYQLTGGANNCSIGSTSGTSLTLGEHNTFLGTSAGTNTTTGDHNIAIGSSCYGDNTGNHNICMGNNAGGFSSGSSYNVCIGFETAKNHGNYQNEKNTVIGYHAGYKLFRGDKNVAIGVESLWSVFDGDSNVAIGDKAGYNLKDTHNNTFVGHDAGSTSVSGANLTCLGYGAEPTSTTVTNEVTIGNSSVTKFRVPGVSLEVTSSGVSDAKGNLRSIPRNLQSSNYTLVAADAGKHIYCNNNPTITIPAGTFASGDAITIINASTSDMTISRASGVSLYMPDGGDANCTVGKYGMVTLLHTVSDLFWISGSPLSQ